MRTRLIFAFILAAGCGGARTAPPTLLAPTDRLVRVAMALKGTRPALSELEAVERDPAALETVVDGYLGSDEFAETIRDLHNEFLLMRAYVPGLFDFPTLGKLAQKNEFEVMRSVLDAPLHLIEHIVMNDRPYTEIVTADYTIADGNVATVWGMEYDGNGAEWRLTKWPDARPRAGVLSEAAFFYRHTSTPSNANRGRANRVAKAFLCEDFDSRDIPISGKVDVSSPDSLKNALSANAACVSCHQTLDPLASFFFGYSGNFILEPPFFKDYVGTPTNPKIDPSPLKDGDYPVNMIGWADFWKASAVNDWKTVTGRAPAYFGQGANRVDQLGQLIAEDPRFSLCTAKRFWAYFNQVDLGEVPLAVASRLQKELVDSGWNARRLVRSIVLSDEFLAAGDDRRGYKRAGPEQLARLVADLTGFRWQVQANFNYANASSTHADTLDLAKDSALGYAVLAGGIDSFWVTTPSRVPNATTSLYLRNFARAAAGWTVDRDLALESGERRLLTDVAATDSDEEMVRAQLSGLYRRIYGARVPAHSAELDDGYQLFTDALAKSGEVARAWKVTLAGMLQDPRILYY
jgi:hypothetical protein